MPCRAARSRTMDRPYSRASPSAKVECSSSIRPASTLDRSRISLSSSSRCLPGAADVAQVLLLALVEVAEHALEQHLGEADDGVERRPQLVRHAGQELGLVPARDLELGALALQLAEQPRVEDGERPTGWRRSPAGRRSRRRTRRASCGARQRADDPVLAQHGHRDDRAPPASCRTLQVRVERPPRRRSGDLLWRARSSAARPTRVSSRSIRVRRRSSTSVGARAERGAHVERRSASSNSKIEPPSVPESWTACVTIVDSTSSTSRLELTACPTSPSASSWSTLRASSSRPCLERADQVDTADRHGRLGGEGREELVVAIVERVDLGAPHRQRRRRARRRGPSGTPSDRPEDRPSRWSVEPAVVGIGEHVRDLLGRRSSPTRPMSELRSRSTGLGSHQVECSA